MTSTVERYRLAAGGYGAGVSEDCCEVVVTAADADWLAEFTRRLVADRLAACGHVIPAIRSIYRWEGAVQDEGEARVGLHTRVSLVPGDHRPGRRRAPVRRAVRDRAADPGRQPRLPGLDPGLHRGSRMSPKWTLDELAYAGAEHLDADFVAGYDRKQGFPSPEPDLAVLASHGALGPTVVDLGTGTGRFAVAAAARCERVVAVDVSPAMLAHVRASAPSTVEVVRAGFLSYEHTGAPADAVHTRNALHQLPDFWKGIALDRIARILRPGGILRLHDLVYDVEPARGAGGLRRLVRRRRDRPGGRLHGRGLRRAHPHRAQHVPVAAGADAGAHRLRDPRLLVRAACVRHLHLPPEVRG